MKTVFILLDSLNRQFLPIYGNDRTAAPNFQRHAEKGIVMDNNWLGSAPCIPALSRLLLPRFLVSVIDEASSTNQPEATNGSGM